MYLSNFVKKNTDNITFFILAIFCMIIINFLFPVASLDELWKYNHTKAIVGGYVPYKDVNIMTTPFYFFSMGLFLLFDKTLFAFRVGNIIFKSIIVFMLYLNLKKYTKSKVAMFLSMFISFLLFTLDIGTYFFDYNSMFFLLVLCATYMYNNIENKDNKFYFIFGIVYAFMDLTKQSAGLIAVFLILFYVVFIKKETIKHIAMVLLGLFIPNFFFLIYLLGTNSFFSFFDICLFGLDEFANNLCTLSNFVQGGILNILILLSIIVGFAICLIRCIKKQKTYIFYMFNFISLCFLAYPITDFNHLSYVLMFSLLVAIIAYGDNFYKIFSKLNNVIIGTIYFFILILCGLYCIDDTYVCSKLKNIENFPVSPVLENEILSLNKYINDNYGYENTIILSSKSVIYSITQDVFHGYYDTFLIGNIGTNDYVQYVDKSAMNGKIICISNNYETENWQNPIEVYSYVTNNYKKIDAFGNYCFYIKEK